MEFSVSLPCLFRGQDFYEAIHTVKDLGFNYIETFAANTFDVEAVKKACSETGVELYCFCTGSTPMTDPKEFENCLKILEEACIMANNLNCKKIICLGGQDTGASHEEQFNLIVKVLKSATSIFEKYEVMAIFEPLNSLINHKGYFVDTSTQAFKIIR